MRDYSQNGEQKIILDYFGDLRGVALDIGANDGITFSNSRALIQLGWNSVLVEPAAMAFSKLTAIHRNGESLTDYNVALSRVLVNGEKQNIALINAAITTQDGPLDFYSSGTHLKKGDTDLLSTTVPAELARWKKSGEVFTKTTVRGITFETLMKETGCNHFDFISVDAEGADWDIVSQIDLTAVGCRMLCVEVNQRGDAEFTEYAAKHGMRLHWKCTENRIFTRKT